MALARERLGERGSRAATPIWTRRCRSRRRPFELIVSSLTMHYLRDWAPVLRELARVLRPAGRVRALDPPPVRIMVAPGEAYHASLVDDAWDGFAAPPVAVRYYHRPLERIVADLLDAGFRLRGLHEAAADRRDGRAQRRRWRRSFARGRAS